MLRILCVLTMMFFITSNTMAEKYYVSDGGSNSANGSQQNPWETLQYAADQIGAGDTVIVLAGDYEGFEMDNDPVGTSANPIVFLAQPGAAIVSRCDSRPQGINLEGTDYVVLDGFTIRNTNGSITQAGIRSVVNTGVIIRNNDIDGMGTWGILTGFSENITIEYNSCSNSGDEHGIYVGNSADNPIIRYNTCFGNAGCGIHMNADINTTGPNLDGIISYALVEGNIIYNNQGGAGINMDGIQNSIVRNNLIYNNTTNSGIAVFHIDGAEGSKNNTFVNNTVIMPSEGGWALNINTGSTGAKVYNNIFFNLHEFRGGISIDQDCIQGFQSDYNVTIDRFSTHWGDQRLTYSEWRSETGQDEHSIITDPASIFIDYENNDYRLQAGCDAVDSGTVNYAPTSDLRGVARPQGSGYDIGAYEYTSEAVGMMLTESPDNILISPNPVSESITFKIEKASIRAEILDLQGRLVFTVQQDLSGETIISIPDMPSGIYYLKVYTADKHYIVKPFIKK